MPAVREALGAVRVARQPGFVRYPRRADTFEERGGTRESVAALDRLVDDLLQRLLDDDLGCEYLATRRDGSGHVIVAGDRWGMLRLPGEALRLAAGRASGAASFEAGSYLPEIEDIMGLGVCRRLRAGGTTTTKTEALGEPGITPGRTALSQRGNEPRHHGRQSAASRRSRTITAILADVSGPSLDACDRCCGPPSATSRNRPTCRRRSATALRSTSSRWISTRTRGTTSHIRSSMRWPSLTGCLN